MTAPKLRFKEFDGDWKSDKVGKFLIEYKQKVPSSTDIEIYSSSRNGLKPQKEYFDNRELQNFGEYGVVPPNYLTYRHMSDDTTFKFNINLIGKKIAVSKEYPVFTTNEFMDSSFLLFKLNESNDFKKFAIEQKKGGTRTRLYFKALCTWETLLPTKEEQTKIASFLSAVDDKINQLTQKHQLLSQYKQGMMQKLFSQQIRFKADDGSDFAEWRKTKFSDQFTFKNTNSYSRALLAENGEIMNIHYGDIHTKYSMLFDVSKERIPFLSEEIDTTRISKDQFLQLGDLVVADASEDYKDIGKTIEVIYLNNSKVVAGLHTFVARPIQQFALGFNGYLMQTFAVREQIQKLATGISVLGISKTNLSKIAFDLPCLAEQTKIANFLSAIDQKIEVTAQQIEQAKLWKKGLLQQMFV